VRLIHQDTREVLHDRPPFTTFFIVLETHDRMKVYRVSRWPVKSPTGDSGTNTPFYGEEVTAAPLDGPPPGTPVDIVGRLRVAWPLLALSLVSVVAGGLVAAVVARAPTEHPVWASAYLALVTGVAQAGLIVGRVLLVKHAARPQTLHRDAGIWVLGNVGVLVGTLTERTWLVDVGGALLVVALALCVWAVRGHSPVTTGHRWAIWLLWLYRVIVVVLLVSIPVGLFVARR